MLHADLIGAAIDGGQAILAAICAWFHVLNHHWSRGSFSGKGYWFFLFGFVLYALEKVSAAAFHLIEHSSFFTVDDLIDSLGFPILILFFLGFHRRYVNIERYARNSDNLQALRKLTEDIFGKEGGGARNK